MELLVIIPLSMSASPSFTKLGEQSASIGSLCGVLANCDMLSELSCELLNAGNWRKSVSKLLKSRTGRLKRDGSWLDTLRTSSGMGDRAGAEIVRCNLDLLEEVLGGFIVSAFSAKGRSTANDVAGRASSSAFAISTDLRAFQRHSLGKLQNVQQSRFAPLQSV